MADGRFLSKSTSQSEQLSSDAVSLEAAFLFTWCIPHLDVEGRMTGHPQLLKASVCPLRHDLPVGRIPTLLAELVKAELVVWYAVEGKQVLAFPGFPRQQKGLRKRREARSKLPSPTAHGATAVLATDPSQLSLPVETPRLLRSGTGPASSGVGPEASRNENQVGRRPPAEVEVEVEGEVEVEVEVEAEAEATHAAAADQRRRLAYVIACTVACNDGLHANPRIGDRCNELVGSSQTAPLDWYDAGIPTDVAVDAIRATAIVYHPKARNPQPRDLRYFDGAVRDAWDRVQQRAQRPTTPTIAAGYVGTPFRQAVPE